MRQKTFASIGCAVVMTAMPANAQSNPGRSAAEHRSDMANATRSQEAQLIAEFQRMDKQDLAKFAAAYRAETEPHRRNALDIVERAHAGPLPANAGERIRAALEADLDAWHKAFQVRDKEWKAM